MFDTTSAALDDEDEEVAEPEAEEVADPELVDVAVGLDAPEPAVAWPKV